MAASVLSTYNPSGFYCELIQGNANQLIRDRFGTLSVEDLKQRAAEAEAELHDLSITFTVYSDKDAIDRVLPFDVIPRVLSAREWEHIERGVIQRVTALNLLLHDLYHEQKIIKEGVIPADLIFGNPNYRTLMQGVDLPHRTYVNICGTDLIRDEHGTLMVLEDNARTPSGVSYVVENRHMMLRAFPDLLDEVGLRSIDDYGLKLFAALREVAPPRADDPQVVLL